MLLHKLILQILEQQKVQDHLQEVMLLKQEEMVLQNLIDLQGLHLGLKVQEVEITEAEQEALLDLHLEVVLEVLQEVRQEAHLDHLLLEVVDQEVLHDHLLQKVKVAEAEEITRRYHIL